MLIVVVICDVGSSKRRCGGQGDIVCGTIGTFAGWHDIMQAQGNDVQKGIGIAEKLAGACSLVRRMYLFFVDGRCFKLGI